MDKSAINAIGTLSVDAQRARVLNTDTPAIVLRDADGLEHVESLERFASTRSRFRGTYSTSSINDFMRAVVSRGTGGAQGFIDVDRMTARVFFNLGIALGEIQPGHADDIAELHLKPTPAFAAFKVAASGVFTQKPLVEWLEDWADQLTADFGGAVHSADAADPRAIKAAIAALRRVKIKATSESTHTDKNYGHARSALEDVEASAEGALPQGFRFTCVPYEGFDSHTFAVRLRIHPDDDKPTFKLHWARAERDAEALAAELNAKLSNGIGDKAALVLGTFDPGK